MRLCHAAADSSPETSVDAIDQIESLDAITTETATRLIDLIHPETPNATRNAAALALTKLSGPAPSEIHLRIIDRLSQESSAAVRETLIQVVATLAGFMTAPSRGSAREQLRASMESRNHASSPREARIAELAIKRLDSIDQSDLAAGPTNHDSSREAG